MDKSWSVGALKAVIVAAVGVMMLGLTSCESKYVRGGRQAYSRYFERFVPNPSTIEVLEEKYEADGKKVDWTVTIVFTDLAGDRITRTFDIETFLDRVMIVNGEFYWDDKINYSRDGE